MKVWFQLRVERINKLSSKAMAEAAEDDGLLSRLTKYVESE